MNVAKYIGAESSDDVPKLKIPDEKMRIAKEYFDNRGVKNIVLIHPGASQAKRLWFPDRFAMVIKYLWENSYNPVLISGPNDNYIIESIRSKCGVHVEVLFVPLAVIAAYLFYCKLFIGLDSGIAHIAAAVGKNVIVLFGPQDTAVSSPRGSGVIRVIRKGDFMCRPCSVVRCNHDNACMQAIQSRDVALEIESLFDADCE